MAWDEIKYALNSTVGDDNFKPLDTLVSDKIQTAFNSASSYYPIGSSNIQSVSMTYSSDGSGGVDTILDISGTGMLYFGIINSTVSATHTLYFTITVDGVTTTLNNSTSTKNKSSELYVYNIPFKNSIKVVLNKTSCSTTSSNAGTCSVYYYKG